MGGKSLRKSCLTLCMALAVGMCGQVFAQDDEEFTLEEIVVTAEKREAELQKIPMDISVVRPEELERLNVHQVEDLDKLLPDLKITRSQGGLLKIQMRDVGGNTEGRGGVTTDYDNPTQETTVAVHVDGAQLTRSDGLEGKLYDLERVETLKGPQGTLYGRGSISGSINLVSKRPDIGNFGGNLTFEYGSYDRRRFSAGFNIPATEKLAFRLSGNIISREGFDDAGVSNQNMWGLRGSMRWEPTDDQSLVVALDTDRTKNRNGDSTGFMWGTVGDLEIVPNPDPGLPESYAPYNKGGLIDSAYKVKWWLGDLSPEITDQQYTNNKSWGINATYDREFEYSYLTITSSYRSQNNVRSYIDVSGTKPELMPVGTRLTQSRNPARTYDPETGLFTEAAPVNDEDFTGEDMTVTDVPLTPELEPIQGYTISRSQTYSYDIPGNTPVTQLMLVPSTSPPFLSNYSETSGKTFSAEARLASVTTVAGGDKYEWIGGAMYMKDTVLEQASITNSAYRRNILDEKALFAQASYAPFWGLNFTGGYRLTWDEKSFYGKTNSGGTGTAQSARNNNERFALPLDLSDAVNSSYKWRHQTYKLNLSWQATENIMPYIQYSKGVKTGNIDGQGNSVDPETLSSYEGGMRTRLFNGRLQINATGYYYEYKNSMASATIYQCLRPQARGETNTCLNAAGNAGFSFGVNPNIHMPVDPNDISKGYRYVQSAAVSLGGTEQKGANLNATWLITPNDTINITAAKSVNKYVDYSMSRAQNEYAQLMWGQYDGETIIVDGEEQIVETYADSAKSNYMRVYDDWNGEEYGGGYNGNVSYNHTWFLGTDTLSLNTTGFYTGPGIDQVMRPSQSSPDGEWGDLEYKLPGNPSYWMWDASITFNSTKWVGAGKRWSLRFYVNNVLEKKIIGRRFQDNIGDIGFYFGQYDVLMPDSYIVTYTFAEPRTMGLIFTLNF